MFFAGNYSKLNNARFYRNGSNLIVEADIYINGDMIGHNQQLEVIPVLSKGKNRLELPLILVNGRRRHQAYRQMCSGIGQQTLEKAYRIYKEMIAGRDLYCRYRQEVSYDGWMEEVNLYLREG